MSINSSVTVYNAEGKVHHIRLFNNNLIVDNHDYGETTSIKFTIYSSGDIIYKTPRNFLNIHFYNYLYKISFTCVNNCFECYIDKRKNIIKLFKDYRDEDKKKPDKIKKLSLCQKSELPLLSVQIEKESILLDNKNIMGNLSYLYYRFPKIAFYEIKLSPTDNNEVSKIKQFIQYKFLVSSAMKFYRYVLMLMLLISLGTIIYLFITNKILLDSSVIIPTCIVMSIFLLLNWVLNFLEKKLLFSFNKPKTND